MDDEPTVGQGKPKAKDEPLRCSFCNASQHEVKKLIAGPLVCICDGCVLTCVQMMVSDGDLTIGDLVKRLEGGS